MGALSTSYDGQPINVRYSAGSQVPYVDRWEGNGLRPPAGQSWPPALLKQVHGYVARRSWFDDQDADALAADLGPISKFQSLTSEDAAPWSWFGTLSCAAPAHRRDTMQWLYDRLGLVLKASPSPAIE